MPKDLSSSDVFMDNAIVHGPSQQGGGVGAGKQAKTKQSQEKIAFLYVVTTP